MVVKQQNCKLDLLFRPVLWDPTIPLQHRKELCITTKHWHNYHGYNEEHQCLAKSLECLQVNYVDLSLIHWLGPAWNTMMCCKNIMEEHGSWYYTKTPPDVMVETWAST